MGEEIQILVKDHRLSARQEEEGQGVYSPSCVLLHMKSYNFICQLKNNNKFKLFLKLIFVPLSFHLSMINTHDIIKILLFSRHDTLFCL